MEKATGRPTEANRNLKVTTILTHIPYKGWWGMCTRIKLPWNYRVLDLDAPGEPGPDVAVLEPLYGPDACSLPSNLWTAPPVREEEAVSNQSAGFPFFVAGGAGGGGGGVAGPWFRLTMAGADVKIDG